MNIFTLRSDVSTKMLGLLALVSLILSSLPIGALSVFAEDSTEGFEVTIESDTEADANDDADVDDTVDTTADQNGASLDDEALESEMLGFASFDAAPMSVPLPHSYITVTPDNLNGWTKSSTGLSDFSNTQARIGNGSYRFNFNTADQKHLQRTAFIGTVLSDITALSYSAYVEARNPGSVVAPVMRIDALVGTTNTTLVYEPAYNGSIAVGEWKDFDTLAANGRWYSTNSIPGFTAGGDAIANMFSWNDLVMAYPTATVRSGTLFSSVRGIYLNAGQNSLSAPWINFVGYVDNFTINNVTYDFEPVTPEPVAPPTKPSLTGQVIYDAITNVLPESYPSVGFQATQRSEFGDRITFEPATGRSLLSAAVTITSWACENGQWNLGDCVTTPGATFNHPITLNLYEADDAGLVGSLITSVTQTFTIPYRPSSNFTCSDTTQWKSTNGDCFNGYNHVIEFDLTGISVPDTVIFGVAYNTQSHGAVPTGNNGAYNSLNVGLNTDMSAPYIGTDVDTDIMYQDRASSPGFKEIGGWSAYRVAVAFTAVALDTTKPVTEVVSPILGGVYSSGTTTLNLKSTDAGTGIASAVANIHRVVGTSTVFVAPCANNTVSPTEAEYDFTCGINIDSLTEGNYVVRANARDGANNLSNTISWTFSVDKTAPTITVKPESIGDETTMTFTEVSFKLFDSQKIDKVEINGVVKDLTNNNWSDVNGVKPGVFGAILGLNTIVAYDVAGNTTTLEFTLVENGNGGGGEPTPVASLTITNPATAGQVLSGEFTFTAEYVDYDDVDDQMFWAIRAGTCNGTDQVGNAPASPFHPSVFDAATGEFSTTVDMSSWAGGTYCLVVNPRESSGPNFRETRLFTLEAASNGGGQTPADTVAPIVNINTPVDGAVVNGNLEVTGTVTDDVALAHYVVTLYPGTTDLSNGLPHGSAIAVSGWGQVNTSATSTSFTRNLDTMTLANGVYQIRVAARDAANNRDVTDPYTGDTTSVHIISFTVNNEVIPEEPNPPIVSFGGAGGPVLTGNNSGTPSVLGVSTSALEGEVLGASTSVGTCGMYLLEYMSLGNAPSVWEVMKLQLFLASRNLLAMASGVFDQTTETSVRAYQTANDAEILQPWVTAGLADASFSATGIVGKTTRWHINNAVCPGSEVFPQLP